MKAYIIKRLLIMIPTFLGILLIIFAVLNFAPGRPGAGQQGSDIGKDIRGEQTEESYRIFREQFHLDKPVLVNTLFALDADDVDPRLAAVLGRGAPNVAERIAARESLEDYGGYAVPLLYDAVKRADAAGDAELRDLAVFFLRSAARRPLVDPYEPDPTPEQRAANRAISAENARTRAYRYLPEAPEEEKRAVLAEWDAWYAEHRERWQYSRGDELRIFFAETRFAAYCRNLARLDFGVSLVSKKPVLDTLISKLPYSLTLSVGSLLLAYLISIPIGIFLSLIHI